MDVFYVSLYDAIHLLTEQLSILFYQGRAIVCGVV